MEGNSENINLRPCPSCSEGNDRKSRFCIHCGKKILRKRKTLFTSRSILLGMMSLFLVGGIVLLWKVDSESKLVGKVNGEGITREEFSRKIDRLKKSYETRYGLSLFQGEEGKENLNRLKTEILDEIITERILLQEARSAGYTSAPEEEIVKYVDAIKKQKGLSEVDLQKMTGGSIEDLKEELRREWTISQFIEKAVLKGDQTNAEQLFGQWLAQTKAKAKIETYEKLKPVLTAKASCCTNGCGGGRAQPLDPKIEQEAKAKGLEYYEKKTQKKAANARVTNFGCHIQVDIIEDGKVLLSLTYNGREVQEI